MSHRSPVGLSIRVFAYYLLLGSFPVGAAVVVIGIVESARVSIRRARARAADPFG